MPSEVESNSMESGCAIQWPTCIVGWVSLQQNVSGLKNTWSGSNRKTAKIEKVNFFTNAKTIKSAEHAVEEAVNLDQGTGEFSPSSESDCSSVADIRGTGCFTTFSCENTVFRHLNCPFLTI